MRRVLAVVAGLAVAVAIIATHEAVGVRLYPLPVGLDPDNREALRAHVSGLPLPAFLIVLLGYAVGSFCGGLVATLIGRRSPRPAVVVGIGLLVAGTLNLLALPHPLWFAFVSTLLYVPAAWLGARVARRDGAVTPAAAPLADTARDGSR